MPLLRRSKSLNDKIVRQKHRAALPADLIRHPKSPAAEGHTRACVSNYQNVIHLRKQAEDKKLQLQLAAYSLSSNSAGSSTTSHQGHRRHPRTESPCAPSVSSSSTTSTIVERTDPSEQGHASPSSASRRSKHPGDRQGSEASAWSQASVVSGGSSDQYTHQPEASWQRPLSMVEGRGSLLEELRRKDLVIRNLMECQRTLNLHNSQLLAKVDELEFENRHQRDILSARSRREGYPDLAGTMSAPSTPLSNKVVSLHSDDATCRVLSAREVAFSRQSSTLVSPVSDTPVSGYGSLAGSGCGEGYGPEGPDTLQRGKGGMGMAGTMGSVAYNANTLPSSFDLGSRFNTLATSTSSGDTRNFSDRSLDSIHDKLDQVLELERHRGRDRKKRIEELETQLAEQKAQTETVLQGYKLLADENDRLLKRDERIQEELGSLLQQHGQSMQEAVIFELQTMKDQLWDLGQQVRGQLQDVLDALAASPSSAKASSDQRVIGDPRVKQLADRVVDLIGPEYLRLGRQLQVPPSELEAIDDTRKTFAEKTLLLLVTWLRLRGEREKEREGEAAGNTVTSTTTPRASVSAAEELTQALRDIDKDVRLFSHDPISEPERQALRKCLQFALQHVTDPADVLDHLIAMKEVTSSGVAFVQEVMGKDNKAAERALSRLWHVSEYRGTGIVEKLGLALKRANYPHVSDRLAEELETQSAQIHTPAHPLVDEDISVMAANSLGSRPSPTPPHTQVKSMSLPGMTRSTRSRSKTSEAIILSDTWSERGRKVPAAASGRTTPEREEGKDEGVWNMRKVLGGASRPCGDGAGVVGASGINVQGSRISRV